MRDDFAIFILSHKNPYKCKTLDTFRDLNFNSSYYIVVDDSDAYLEDYKEHYKDNLLVFNKDEYIKITDTGHSSFDVPRECPLYARNFVEDTAKRMQLKSFIICDDDITGFTFRPLDYENKKLKRVKVENNIEDIFDAYLSFLLDTDIACVGFATPNFYFGGFDAISSGDYIKRRQVCNLYFRNVSKEIDWKFPMEDFCTELLYGTRGYLFLSLAQVLIEVAPQYVQKGGETKVDGMAYYYANTSDFTRAFYSTMCLPSCCSPKMYKGKYIGVMSKDNVFPKILSSSYKI